MKKRKTKCDFEADGGPEVTAEGWQDMKRENGQDDYSKQSVLMRTGCYPMLLGGIQV